MGTKRGRWAHVRMEQEVPTHPDLPLGRPRASTTLLWSPGLRPGWGMVLAPVVPWEREITQKNNAENNK